ncbi:hypothetical protein [Litchfieldia alkalitelluris]|nr:hypothetical protein [Litchfieldia alkalitelluris]
MAIQKELDEVLDSPTSTNDLFEELGFFQVANESHEEEVRLS